MTQQDGVTDPCFGWVVQRFISCFIFPSLIDSCEERTGYRDPAYTLQEVYCITVIQALESA